MGYPCIIIDDEQPARRLLEDFVGRIPSLELLGSFKNPLEAMDCISQQGPQILFLDIQMPQMTGVSFLKTLQNPPQVIFTTAYADYALQGYELNVTDYLLKPLSFERFMEAVNKAQKNLSSQDVKPKTLTIHADHRVYKVQLKEILYIEGMREYVSYYLLDGKRIIALQSLKAIEDTLPAQDFTRTHRSYIVNNQRIDYIEGSSVVIGEKRIPIGRSYKDDVKRALIDE
ncbi:MAG: LytTR family DNA-binding domain-containing protein [Bacteroidota bacterium]